VGTRRAAVPVPHLPTVDLYSEDEPPTPPRPATPQPKPNWWAGLGILAAMMATSFVSAGLLGLDMVVTLTATTAVGGLATVVLALALRHRRIPRLVLAALAASVVATGWLATQTAAFPEFTEDTHVVRIVGTDGTVNLTDLELAGAKTLHVEVIASDVKLILPGPTKSMTTTGWLSDIRMGPDTTATDGNTTPNLNIEVSAKLSDVVIQEAS
ncbi:hypothetical protein ACFQ06_06320, partial [Tessaracoccus lubricantis]